MKQKNPVKKKKQKQKQGQQNTLSPDLEWLYHQSVEIKCQSTKKTLEKTAICTWEIFLLFEVSDTAWFLPHYYSYYWFCRRSLGPSHCSFPF